MKLNKKQFLVLIVACFSVLAFTSTDRADAYPDKESLLMDVMLQSFKYNHYESVAIDDAFSGKVFDLYVDRSDNGKRFFLKGDYDKLAEHRLKLDDYALNRDFDFFDELNDIRDKRIDQVRAYYKEILAKPFDFEEDESLETDSDKMAYAKNDAELRLRWHKLLKFRVMDDIYTKTERQEKILLSGESDEVQKSFEEMEIESREKELKEMDRWFVNIDQEDREDKVSLYINTFANAIEPHTSYFPPLDKENFDIRMSGKLEGIGAQLLQKDGYTKVTRIVPGSASWTQGELEVNDLIIKVAQGSAEAVNVVDMKMDDVLPLIRGEKGTEVRLTIKKSDGSIKVISIIRDIVVLEESYAKSALLVDKKNKTRVGLIDLRTFYADFEDPLGRRCSRDVKAEVQKLIDEGVDGIVIDLRYNGGGSLSDAIDMSGLFIDQGPIVQVEKRGYAPESLSDRDNRVQYDGPLVILVNSYSASASEIMAAALQDYGRAIIVGTSPSTFGKGTVQRFFQLNDVVPESLNSYGDLGALKITIQKFFRINGGSTQLKGVTPDIILPGRFSYLETGEKEEDYPLSWTEISPATYGASSIKNINKIKQKSSARVAVDANFKMLDDQAHWFKSLQDNSEVSLNLKKYSAQKADFNKTSEAYKALEKEIDGLSVSVLKADAAALKSDTVRSSSMETWHKAVKKDLYLMEVVNIIGDWK
jgi:carboxyl-terminal processing protease